MRRTGISFIVFVTVVLASTRHAAALPVIYFDDFEQFTGGTDLTEAVYTPVIGTEAKFDSFESVAATVTATDFGGNIAALWTLPPLSGEDYLARFAATHIEEIVDISFRFEALDIKTAGFGGFFVRFPTPTLDMQLLAGFLDDGRLVVFTDTPSPGTLEPLASTYLANHTYDVRLLLDLPGNQYSWFLDGTPVVLNRPIPPHINSQQMHQFGFDSNEAMGGLGNAFVIDDVRAEIGSAPEPSAIGLLVLGLSAFSARLIRAGRRLHTELRTKN